MSSLSNIKQGLLITVLLSICAVLATGLKQSTADPLVGKTFWRIISGIDGHFIQLQFLPKNKCVLTKGSVSWGGPPPDTIQYELQGSELILRPVESLPNYFECKRLFLSMHSTLEEHSARYGFIEGAMNQKKRSKKSKLIIELR